MKTGRITRFTILIGPSSFAANDDTPLVTLRESNCEVVPNPYGRRYTRQEISRLLRGVHGLIAGLEPLDREILSGAEDLRVISRCGVGMSNVDVAAAAELGIKVLNTPDAPTRSVAEMTVGCLLAVMRSITQMNDSLHAGRWDKRIGLQLAGKTVAIIGYGRIGRCVAELLRPFDVRILAVDTRIPPAVDGTEMTDLSSALHEADIVSLHVSGDDLILGPAEFTGMKRGVIVLNAARGNNIDESALIGALDNGRVAGAWMDALPEEPYTGHLTHYPQVLLTPHASSYTQECRKQMEMESVSNLLGALHGNQPAI